MSERDWPWGDEHWSRDESEVGECDSCGQRVPVRNEEDPFVAEVYPEDDNFASDWCLPCWQNRKDEV